MLYTELLLELAEQAGFSASTQQSSDFIYTDTFSVCIAAPFYCAGDRYRPFNSKSDEAGSTIERNLSALRAAAASLSADGLMFIYGLPAHLARYATALSDLLTFRYWIAARAMTAQKEIGLRPEHTGLLVLSKPGASLSRIRIPHARCRYCGDTLKDWGGKSHLMHPDGAALSDVWMDSVVDAQDRMPPEVFARTLQLCAGRENTRLLLLIPDGSPRKPQSYHYKQPALFAFNPLSNKPTVTSEHRIPDHLINRLHKAPCLEMLKAIPSGTVDLAFADPPFNLTKAYNGYSDNREEGDYIGWCKRWLIEYERVLKPGGALVVLNLPKWSVWLADFLCRTPSLFLQNWIVWNSLPEPKGVLMPAHYSLLYFTKGKSPARFNYCSMEDGWEPFAEAVFPPDRPDVCQRRSCVRRRRASSETWRGELTDIWHTSGRSGGNTASANGSQPSSIEQ